MKAIASLVFLLGLASYAYGLDCYTCTDSSFNGEPGYTGNCFSISSTTTPKVTCDANSGSTIYYCRTMFTVTDGLLTGVSRGCQNSTSDEDSTTDAVPQTNKCLTTIDQIGDPTDSTDCYYHCTADNCNSATTSTLNLCSSNCSRAERQGYCNYITGTCVCNSGWTDSTCATAVVTAAPTVRSCVQCNSATDTSCSTSITDSPCPSGEQYCSSAQTWIYGSSDTVIRNIWTRGCTSSFKAIDECAFTNIYSDVGITSSGYNEFTCFSTCDTNTCNTDTPDGILNGNEKVTLQCQQCSSTGTDCNPARTPCTSAATHCKATVVYMISNKADLSYTEALPAYKLASVVRECATAAVTTECTESTIGSLSLKKVTCQETCQTDGCNTGWPARPKCITCMSDTAELVDGYDTCLENPAEALPCSTPYEQYCALQDMGIQEGSISSIKGYTRRIWRGCLHYEANNGCSTETIREVNVQSCNYTCTTDGCNAGSGTEIPVQTVIAVVLPAIFGWLTQLYL